MKLENVIYRDTRANQPAASSVAVGTRYYVTDEYIEERSSGSAWESVQDGRIAEFGIIIDGGGAVLTTGVKADFQVPIGGTILSNTLLADQSGSIVIDIWKDTYGNYPPTVADTITAAAKPTITTATKSTDSTLTGWTTSFSAGDTFRFNIDSVTTITRVFLALKILKA